MPYHRKGMTKENVDKENENNSFLRLPDNILMLVLQNLDFFSLVHASKACRRLYHISNDKVFTNFVDLRAHPMGLRQLWNFSYKKLSQNTTSFHVRGKSSLSKIMEKLTIPYLSDLNARCSNLKRLSLEHFDLRDIPLEHLAQSKSLLELSVSDSMLPMGWFNILRQVTILPKLKILNLHSCSKISNNDLETISYLNTLEALILCNCHRISARGIPVIARNLQNLKHVNFSGCPAINDVALFHISELHLQTLSLRFCHLVTDYGITQLFKATGKSHKSLKKLDLYSCHELTDKTLDCILLNANQLKYLSISGCSKLTDNKIAQFCEVLPNCEVHNEIIEDNGCDKNENNYQCCQLSR